MYSQKIYKVDVKRQLNEYRTIGNRVRKYQNVASQKKKQKKKINLKLIMHDQKNPEHANKNTKIKTSCGPNKTHSSS